MGVLHSSGHEACPTHDLSEEAYSPLIGSMSFYDFNKILGGSFAGFAMLVMFLHIFHHANRLSNPGEQVKIMRIAMLIPYYALFSFLSICFPQAKVYLLSWIDVFQAAAMASFFLLMCDFISPSSNQRELFFSAMTISHKNSDKVEQGLDWYKKRWILIFQYPVVQFIVALATDITEAAGIYCDYLTKPYYAKLWLTVIKSISLGLAVVAVLKFTIQLKTALAQHRPMAKLFSFKVVVLLAFVQNILFLILGSVGVLQPTSTLTYADVHMGIPSLLNCIEMVPISLLIVWAYPVRPYLIRRSSAGDYEQGNCPRSYQGGVAGISGLLAMLSPMETLEAILFTVKSVIGGQRD